MWRGWKFVLRLTMMNEKLDTGREIWVILGKQESQVSSLTTEPPDRLKRKKISATSVPLFTETHQVAKGTFAQHLQNYSKHMLLMLAVKRLTPTCEDL